MTAIGPRRGELAQPVADHILRNKNRYMPASVVDTEGQANHIGHYHRSPGPSPDDGLGAQTLDGLNFFGQFGMYEGPFLIERDILASPAPSHNELAASFVHPPGLVAQGGLTPRGLGSWHANG